jgi:antitoxin PrlF
MGKVETSMPTSTVTSKGQITLPKEIRDRLGLKTGDRVAFRERPDGTFVLEAPIVDLRQLRGSIRARVRGVTVATMKEKVRRRAARR